MTEPMPPQPKDGAGVRPEDGDQDDWQDLEVTGDGEDES